MKIAFFFFPLLLVSCAGLPKESLPAAARDPVRPGRDTFAFANETVWHYEAGVPRSRPLDAAEVGGGERYTRRCFVMARAVVQFKKFARFEPGADRAGDEELAREIRRICAIPVWHPAAAPEDRIVVRGWPDLHHLSRDRPGLVQQHIGLGWPTYFRPGNFGIVFPPGRGAQERTAEGIDALWAAGEPPILWLVNFPSLSINHAVVVVGRTVQAGGAVRYRVYDPNLPDAPQALEYDPVRRSFRYPPTFYFRGGEVDVRLAYRGHLQ